MSVENSASVDVRSLVSKLQSKYHTLKDSILSKITDSIDFNSFEEILSQLSVATANNNDKSKLIASDKGDEMHVELNQITSEEMDAMLDEIEKNSSNDSKIVSKAPVPMEYGNFEKTIKESVKFTLLLSFHFIYFVIAILY